MESASAASRLNVTQQKQEHLVKLAILTTAAILCEYSVWLGLCEVRSDVVPANIAS